MPDIMKNKIDYWLDTLSPSLLFIAGFFVLFFIYFSWLIGVYFVLIFLFLISIYFVFFKESSQNEELKLDEAILNQFEEYKKIFSISQEGMVLLVGDELYAANSLFEDLVGKTTQAIRSREWLKLIHNEDLLPFIDWVHQGNHNLDQSLLLRVFNGLNGEILWVKARKLSIPTLGIKNSSIISFKDVSDQKSYQEKALESQIQIYTLIDFAPIAVIIFDSFGNPEYINNFGHDLIGYTRLELMQMGFVKLVVPEKLSSFQLQWDKYLKEGSDSFVSSTTLVSIKGNPLEVVINCVAVKNLEEKITSYFLTIVDLTETQKLASKNQFFVGLLNNSDCISIVDSNGIIVDTNKLFEEKVANRSVNIIGTSYNKLFLGKNGLPEILSSLKKDDVYRDEIFHQVAELNVWLDRTFIPYFVGSKVEHYYVIHRDISQRVHQEIEIKRNNNVLKFLTTAQNDFISSSHDKISFKNILEKISYLKETSWAFLVNVERAESQGLLFSILSNLKNSLYVDDGEDINNDDLLDILNSENLFGNSPLFESPLLVNSLNNDFGPFDERLNVDRINNFISFPILRNQHVIGLLVLINSRNKPSQSDIKIFEPVITSLATMIFAYKEVSIRNQVELENKKLQETISNQLQQLEQILRSSPDTYMMFDPDGVLQFISKKTMNFLESGRVFVEGNSIFNLAKFKYDYASLFVELFEKSKKGLNAHVVLNDPSEGKDYQLEFLSIKNSNSEVSSVLCAIRDITEQKLYERELSIARDSALVASESKSEYLASLYKELESPLSTLLNLISMFEEKKVDDESHKIIVSFSNAAKEINSHVERFFNLTVSPITDLALTPATVNVEQIFNVVLRDFQEIFKQKNITFLLEKNIDTSMLFKSSHVDLNILFKVVFEFIQFWSESINIESAWGKNKATDSLGKIYFKFNTQQISDVDLKYLRSNELVSGTKLMIPTLNLKKLILSYGIDFDYLLKTNGMELVFIFNEGQTLYSLTQVEQIESINELHGLGDQASLLSNDTYVESNQTILNASAVVFEHRADYLDTLLACLKNSSINFDCVNSFKDCLEFVHSNSYDFVFIDLSYSLPEIEEILRVLENSRAKKVVASLPMNMQTAIRKNEFDTKILFIPRPYKKSDILKIIQTAPLQWGYK